MLLCIEQGAGDPIAQLQRAACYVSFSRKALASEETLAARRLMVERHIGEDGLLLPPASCACHVLIETYYSAVCLTHH